MAFSFKTFADVPPIPAGPRAAARQALLIQEKVDAAGSLAAAVDQAVHAILDASPDDPPSELLRLRLLYQHAYSRTELEQLVRNTLRDLGVGARG